MCICIHSGTVLISHTCILQLGQDYELLLMGFSRIMGVGTDLYSSLGKYPFSTTKKQRQSDSVRLPMKAVSM